MYKLLKDKNNEFQCEIKLEGASAQNAKVRLFLEGDNCEYSFNGKIENEQCIIPLGRLKKFVNLLESGKIRLEVVADDTLFVPYENTYELEAEKRVTVEVKQPEQTSIKTMVEVKVAESVSAPKVEAKLQPKPTSKLKDPINEIESYFTFKTKFDGTAKGFYNVIKDKQHKNFFNNICETYSLDKVSVIKQILK
jgi:hypothetical protein